MRKTAPALDDVEEFPRYEKLWKEAFPIGRDSGWLWSRQAFGLAARGFLAGQGIVHAPNAVGDGKTDRSPHQ